MPVKIGKKDYVTVAERVKTAHKDNVKSITTEILNITNTTIVIKATVITHDDRVFTGIAQEMQDDKHNVNKFSWVENCETSAVGRALGFANYDLLDGIATAEEMRKVERYKSSEAPKATPDGEPIVTADNLKKISESDLTDKFKNDFAESYPDLKFTTYNISNDFAEKWIKNNLKGNNNES